MIELCTSRLRIRDPLPSDLEGWHRLKSNTENMRFVPYLQTRSLEESRADLQSAIKASRVVPRNTCFFSVLEAETDTFLGTIGFRRPDDTLGLIPENGQAGEAGWFFLPEAQGKGYATEAFAALLPTMFDAWGVTLVVASCYVANRASERVMQKAGMTYIHEYGEPGQRRAQYQMTKEEFEAR